MKAKIVFFLEDDDGGITVERQQIKLEVASPQEIRETCKAAAVVIGMSMEQHILALMAGPRGENQ